MATSFVEEVVDYLQAGGIGTRGDDLFVVTMPDDEGDGPTTVLQEFPGGQMPLYSRAPTINMAATIRAKDYDVARGKAADIANYLHATTDIILEHSRVLVFICNTAGSIGMDDRQRQMVRMMISAKAHSYTPPAEDGSGGNGDGDSGTGGGGNKDPNPGDVEP